ncbi:MAG TPA: PKD domain-containing protein [Gemmatimonadaceae bacterium]|nr:PKD domain-containing protein [Gemmatimonadaceae bacterium]
MKKFILVTLLVTGAVLPAAPSASEQQTRVPLIANDWCFPRIGEGGWETACFLSVIEGALQTAVVDMGNLSNSYPTWSPDSLRIAFTDGRYIYLYDRTTGTSSMLTDAIMSAGPLSWSPDGRRIAAAAAIADGTGGWVRELVAITPDGMNVERLTTNVGFTGDYAWSPSGSALAFGRAADGVQELYLMNADGSNQTRLTSNIGFAGGVSFSPAGDRIAFNCGTTICAVNVDGTNAVQLAPGFTAAATASFSRDGRQIAFLDHSAGYGEVIVMNGDGSVIRVAPGSPAATPRWSPDGASLAFVLEGVQVQGEYACPADGSPCGPAPADSIGLVNADGTNLRYIGEGTNPTWYVPQPGQPAAAFTAECTGAACTFSAAGSFDADGSLASYEWKFGDGTTGTGATAVHTYATGGTYRPVLIVTDNDGKRDATTKVVVANAAPVASFTSACDGPSCTFDGSASADADGAVVHYAWTFGDGTYADGPGAVVTHRYASGTFTATLWVRDNGGAGSAVASRALTVVNALPVASFSVTCDGLTCAYDASASSDPDGTAQGFSWDFGFGPGGYNGSKGSYKYSSAGTYTITVTVTDDTGQTSSASQTVTVVFPPMHVGDLDGSSVTLAKSWNATVAIEVHGATHGKVDGATVTGTWENGSTAACSTDGSGRCSITRTLIPRSIASVRFTVNGATRPDFLFNAAGNHDAEGDSNGTAVTIKRQ